MLTQHQIKELFTYKDGHLYWREYQNCKAVAGSRAGYFRKSNCAICVVYKGREYTAARLIYLLRYGSLPKIVWHKDGNKMNNRIENLDDHYTRR